VLPLIQVKEFWPDISMGGAFFTPGHAAMVLSENWPETRSVIEEPETLAAYYVAVRGVGRGSVRTGGLDHNAVTMRYDLADGDLRKLSTGLARLASLLFAGGARAIYPSVYGIPAITSEMAAVRWLDERLPRSALSATTVHAFSSCPMGERRDRCAVNSFGKVFDLENLYVNDASILPDSPGVNPQGSVMAFASRNVLHFLDEKV
jgi:choline dehydrogenase-like flavoprotein